MKIQKIIDNIKEVVSSYLMPDEHKENLLGIDFDLLQSKGYKCALIDIDNTLVERKYSFPEWKMKKLIDDLKVKKWTIIILSNNRLKTRAIRVADFLEVSCIYRAIKPFPWVYKKIFKDYNCTAKNTLCIGDQLFMDILGGNIVGCRTIYVDPLGPEQKLYRAIYIWFERLILGVLEKFL
jgi:HAD superfamily phosphatase (TIGR01668 family)